MCDTVVSCPVVVTVIVSLSGAFFLFVFVYGVVVQSFTITDPVSSDRVVHNL